MQKVAAYCRVSTEKDDQINSLESQKKYFHDYIQQNPCWELTKVYVDEGITGTSTKKRYSFHRMIGDAENHNFDLILTKEISRFARNTLDSIFYTRKLKELGIGIIFMNDNINTLDSDAELRLTIMSSIAQEESRKTSERVKWGQKRRMEQGVVFGRDMLGYDVRNGMLYVNEEGAKIVREIFHKFVNEGKGTHVIAHELYDEGVPTSTYMKQWSNVVILRILRNEKYCGDLIQKKTYTPNYLNHEKKINHGEEEFIILHDHHEAIISKRMFECAQNELRRRSPSNEQKSKYSNRYCFSGKIKCGICGASFVSHTKKRKDGSIYKTWRCYEAVKHGTKYRNIRNEVVGCNCPSLHEEDLESYMMQVIKNLTLDKQSILNRLTKMIRIIMNQDNPENMIEKLQNKNKQISSKKQVLLDLYLNNDIMKLDFQRMSSKYEEEATMLEHEINVLRTQKEHNNDNQQANEQMIENIEITINNLINGEEWNDTFYRNILDKIVVYDQNTVDVYLNILTDKI